MKDKSERRARKNRRSAVDAGDQTSTMGSKRLKYRGYDIAFNATPSHFAGLWIGHYDIVLMGFRVASASVSGPHRTEQAAADSARRTAEEFIQAIVESSS